MRLRDIFLEISLNLINLILSNILDIGLLLIAIFTAYISLKVYKSSTDPQIEFSLENYPDSFKDGKIQGNLFLRFKNYGKTPAYNILIKSNRKLTLDENKNFRFQKKSTILDLEDGKEISFLPSDSEKWFILLDAVKLFESDESKKMPKFEFLISWEIKNFIPFLKNKTTQEIFVIDYKDYQETLLNYKDEPIVRTLAEIKDQLEKISKYNDKRITELLNVQKNFLTKKYEKLSAKRKNRYIVNLIDKMI